MKLMKTLKYILLFSMLSMVFIACDDDEVDTTKPEITVVAPEAETIYHPGETITIQATFTDNIELDSYKIDIHDNFDGHDHDHKKSTNSEEPFIFSGSWDFEKGLKSATITNTEIVIPELIDGEEVAHGEYHLMIYCADAAGNENNTVVEIIIEHDEH